MIAIDSSSSIAYLSGGQRADVDGYWERAGPLRATVLAQGRRTRLAATLITQSFLDHDGELVTRDRDFIAFASAAGLRLLAAQSVK